MEQQASSVIDVGTDAMLELEEMAQDLRRDAPALKELFEMLRTPSDSPTFAGNSAVSMLADVRVYPVLREATGLSRTTNQRDYEKLILSFLSDLELGVDREEKHAVRKAKSFCSSLVSNLIAKDMTEVFSRKENPESHYMTSALI